MTSTSQTPSPVQKHKLLVPRSEAEEKIKTQIEIGRVFCKITIDSNEDLRGFQAETSRWSKYNIDLLSSLFDDVSLAEEYKPYWFGTTPGNAGIDWWANAYRKEVEERINRLESILERIPLFSEFEQMVDSHPNISPSREIFIVHGHDELAKESAARFIEKLGLNTIILHEQPNAGRTIIEKFEDHANVGFAIVLLTPDDIGTPQNNSNETKPRARQNVILELGYFMGKLGRGGVCALYKEGVEIPSDYQGVLYIPMDSTGAWKMQLAKEIKNASIDVDLNKVI